MLVNGMLFSIEAINSLTPNHINLLEDCDKKLMRRIFEAEQGTPVESFYLESSAWPFRFILMGRQLMYYWTILQKSETELVRAVFNAQRDFPTEGSWISEVQGVLQSCEISFTEEEIKKMSQFKFKKIVKEKIQVKVLVYLVKLQNKHTKSENLHLDSKMQKYLRSDELTLSQKKLLFLLRSKMLKIKANFSAFHKNDLTCSLCMEPRSEESETHLLSCPTLKQDKVLSEEMNLVKYKDVFGETNEQKKVCQVFTKIMAVYEKNKRKDHQELP
jgi:hypothetical protein